jgi:hypothetical protein
MASKIKVDQLETADGSGTIALQNQLSGMTTASLPALGSAQMPTGSVLQVVKTSATAQQATTSTSWVDTNLSLAITPSASSSKIHIQYNFQNVELTVGNCGCSFRIMRDSTSLFTPGNGYSIYVGQNGGYWQYGDIALDSPSTTSSVTYKIQVRTYNTNGVNLSAGGLYKNTLILTEIAG